MIIPETRARLRRLRLAMLGTAKSLLGSLRRRVVPSMRPSGQRPDDVVVLAVNTGMADFARNLVRNLDELGVRSIVYGLDRGVAERIPGSVTHSDVTASPGFVEFDTADFGALQRSKLSAALSHLRSGENVLFLDADVVVKRDPFPELRRDVDLNIQYGATEDLPPTRPFHNMCAGVWYARSSPKTIAFFDDAFALMERDGVDDQTAINRLYWQGDHELDIAILDPQLFPNGHVWTHNSLDDWVLLHANHVIGRAAKIEMLETTGLFSTD